MRLICKEWIHFIGLRFSGGELPFHLKGICFLRVASLEESETGREGRWKGEI